ncbi:hypothetical protein FDC58_12105 [Clostridium botulinum]|nr:hypothetical protein [Clostridium botulinum]NFO89293.1 hypothetical protein [Clostridium botulinum]NFP29962.1 hypothetical protein [Clostridium botulinum]
MNLKATEQLIDNVISNEFNHISEFKELEDLKKNEEIINLDSKKDKIYEKLYEVAPGQDKLIDDLESAECEYWCMVARYYFKMGVVAGVTNLSFLKDTGII